MYDFSEAEDDFGERKPSRQEIIAGSSEAQTLQKVRNIITEPSNDSSLIRYGKIRRLLGL